MAKKANEKFGIERRDEAAKWKSEVIGTQDFAEDHVMRAVGAFEKGQAPADLMDRSDAPDKPKVG